MEVSKAERTKQFVIEKVAPVFNRKGYSDTKLVDLVKATGLSKGSIYGNFKDKDEVALEAFRHNYHWIRNGIIAYMRLPTTAPGKLKAITAYYRDNFSSLAERGGCPLLNTAIDSANVHPTLEKEVAQAFTDYRNMVYDTIEAGKARQEIHAHINSKQYAGLLIMLIEGGIALTKGVKDHSFLMDALDRVDKIIETELTI